MKTLPARARFFHQPNPDLVTSLGQLIGCHALEVAEDSQESEFAMSKILTVSVNQIVYVTVVFLQTYITHIIYVFHSCFCRTFTEKQRELQHLCKIRVDSSSSEATAPNVHGIDVGTGSQEPLHGGVMAIPRREMQWR